MDQEEASALDEIIHGGDSSVDIYDCDELFLTNITYSHSAKFDPDDMSQPNYEFHITLFYQEHYREDCYTTTAINSPPSVNVVPGFNARFSLYLHLDELEDLPDQHEYIITQISPYLTLYGQYYADDLSWELIEKIITEVLASPPPGHNVFSLDVRVDMEHCHARVQRSLTEQLPDDFPLGMVPATEESIKSLKRKRVDQQGDADKECAICLEDFQITKRKRVEQDDADDQESGICVKDFTEAVLMPCSHLFHGDCIVKWLNTSHYCPVCRFEMPISQ